MCRKHYNQFKKAGRDTTEGDKDEDVAKLKVLPKNERLKHKTTANSKPLLVSPSSPNSSHIFIIFS